MAILIIQGGEYDGHRFEFSHQEFLIGRGANCGLILADSSISKEHARIIEHEGKYVLQDLGSRNGVHLGSDRVNQIELASNSLFRIGPYQLQFAVDESKLGHEADRSLEEVRRSIHGELITALNLRQMNLDQMLDLAFRDRAGKALDALLEGHKQKIGKFTDKTALKKSILDAALGLGPLEDLLRDPTVTEIMVNAPDQIYIEQNGRLSKSKEQFISKGDIYTAIERIVGPIGRRIDESTPLVDARLADGSRVNIVIPPLALSSPSITIRKFPDRRLTIPDLITYNTLSENMARFLEFCVREAKNIVVSGGTGSGKTTLLNVLGACIDEGERIVTIEDSAELQMPQEHIVRLETRPPNIEGKGEYTIRDLVKNALRMRPDRIVVGECRGGEALDMIQAMNTGHDGSLTTAHANSPNDLIRRLEIMVLMAGMDLPLRAVRENIASAVHLIVQINRFPDGSRKVTSISEVSEIYDGEIKLQEIFAFRRTGLTEDRKIEGYFTATGIIPKFVAELRSVDMVCDMSLYVPQSAVSGAS